MEISEEPFRDKFIGRGQTLPLSPRLNTGPEDLPQESFSAIPLPQVFFIRSIDFVYFDFDNTVGVLVLEALGNLEHILSLEKFLTACEDGEIDDTIIPRSATTSTSGQDLFETFAAAELKFISLCLQPSEWVCPKSWCSALPKTLETIPISTGPLLLSHPCKKIGWPFVVQQV